MNLISVIDHEIITILSEHRVVTTQQFQALLGIPERTIRYRLERLWELGLAGGMQPYAERGSSPFHWWPSRVADAFARGAPLPRGGEGEDPKEAFLRHAAAITGLYAALHRLAPTLGWELLSWARETEAREEFKAGGRDSAVAPDVSVVIRAGEAEYHGLVEIDLGTMSIPRAARKFGLFAGWASTGAFEAHHPYLPVILFLTTSERRAESILGKAEQRLSAESHRAYSPAEVNLLDSLVVAVSDAVYRPEAALADPVWTARGRGPGLRLAEILHPPWERWRQALDAERHRAEARRAYRRWLSRDPEAQRRILQERWDGYKRDYVGEYSDHMMRLEPEDREALDALIEETAPMTEVERRAYGFYLRRTQLNDDDEPKDSKETLPVSEEEKEAIGALHRIYLERQRTILAALHLRYAGLPWLRTEIRQLDEGKLLSGWSRRHLADKVKEALRRREAADERMAQYVVWRAAAIAQERRRHGVTGRLLVHTRERVGRAIDEERLRLCPGCEELFPVTEEEHAAPWRKTACPHCRGTEGLLALSEAQSRRLIVLEDGGSWRVRHAPAPRWARRAQPTPGGHEGEVILKLLKIVADAAQQTGEPLTIPGSR